MFPAQKNFFWYVDWLYDKNKSQMKTDEDKKDESYKDLEDWLEDIAYLKWPVLIIFILIFLLFIYLQFEHKF